MPDPVSWLMVRPGWTVLAADGSPIGRVDEVVGDENEDIFDGLSVAVTALGQPRYIDAEHVGRIEEGFVYTSLDDDAARALRPYREPATSLAIEPNDHHGVGETIASDVRKLEGRLVEPTQRTEHPFNLATRIAHLLRRTLGRRRG
jgi:hypothetical protein